MQKSVNITLCFLTAILLIGCRSAKPEVTSEIVADNVAVSGASSFRLHHDSSSISDKVRIMSEDKINFVEGGGAILLSSDGSVSLSGVAMVKYSNSRTSDRRKTKDSFTKQSQTNDSIAVSHQSVLHTETRPAVSSGKFGWKLKIALVLIILLIIKMMISKIRRNKL